MDSCLFYGYYGQRNTGDDAFVEVAAWGSNKYWNIKRNKFLTNNLPNIKNPGEYLGKTYSRGHLRIKQICSILNSNSFICAGGSTFHSEIDFLNPKNIAFLKKKYHTKFKYGAIGVSLGPYNSAAAEAQNIELLKHFDFLALRDKTSYELALTYNLPYQPINAFDLAALLPNVYSTSLNLKKLEKQKIIGLSVCNFESYNGGNIENEKRRNNQIENLVLKLAASDKDLKFRLFIFNDHHLVGDRNLTLRFAEKLKMITSKTNIEIVDYNLETYKTWLKVNECSLVISTRLHFAIFACFSNIPFYLIEYHRKCTDLLIDLEYPNDHRLFDAYFEVNTIAARIIQGLNEEHYPMSVKIDSLMEKAKKNFTEINFNNL